MKVFLFYVFAVTIAGCGTNESKNMATWPRTLGRNSCLGAEVRMGPGKDYRVSGTLKRQYLWVVHCGLRWCKVESELVGWVTAECIEELDDMRQPDIVEQRRWGEWDYYLIPAVQTVSDMRAFKKVIWPSRCEYEYFDTENLGHP